MNAPGHDDGGDPEPGSAQGAPDRAPQVLVVDDDEAARRYLARVLRRAGFRVETAEDPWEALSLCERGAPLVMLVDIRMPQMDGRVLIEELHRRMGADAPRVIFVSSLVGEVELPRLPLVVEAFPKMPDRQALVRAVRRYARGHVRSGRIAKPDRGALDDD